MRYLFFGETLRVILQKCPQLLQVGLKSKLVNLDFLDFLSILCLLNHENQEKAYFIFHLFMHIY